MTVALAKRKHISEPAPCASVLIEMVAYISIIPEDPEIRSCSLHPGKSVACLFGIHDSVRIAVARNAPDTLYLLVLNEFFDNVHVRTVLRHRDSDKLKAHCLGNSEVSVIAGCRAEPLSSLNL